MQKKKLLGSTLALAMILPSASVNAELLKNFKLSGQLDLQGTSASNVTDFATRGNAASANKVAGAMANNDRIGDMQTRLMVSADWDLLDDVHSKVTLAKNDRNWGTAGGNAHGNAQSQAIDAAGVLGNVFVDQAYIKVDKVMGAIDTTLGRQFYGNSGDMIVYFGPSDKALWGMPVTALDTARFDWANDMIGLTGIVGKTAGAASMNAAIPQAGTDLRGLVASLKAKENMSGSVYLYNKVTHNLGASGVPATAGAVSGENDFLWVAGLKGKVAMAGAWLGGEFAKDFGQNRINGPQTFFQPARSYDGWAFKLDAGYKADLGGMGGVTGWGNFGYGTGDNNASSSHNNGFVAIAGDYRPGAIWGRFASAQGAPGPFGNALVPGAGAYAGQNAFASNGTLTNRVLWGVGVKVNPAAVSKLGVGLSWWDYRSQTAALPVSLNGGNLGGQQVYAGNHHIGSELDLDLEWKHSENVSFNAGVGEFLAGGMIKEAVQSTQAAPAIANALGAGTGNNPATLAYFDVRVKF